MSLKSKIFANNLIISALLFHGGTRCSFILPMTINLAKEDNMLTMSLCKRQQAVCRICAETDEKQTFSQYPNSTDLGISSVQLEELTDATLMILEHPKITEDQFCHIMKFSTQKIRSLLGGFSHFKNLVFSYSKTN
ncbi:hypothetical protein [Vibrio sp. F74]|uniref:hypothetical protein n=1 Tax=Vibrio sp. F74 TaxID=700020 RepID=UPI0035F574DA